MKKKIVLMMAATIMLTITLLGNKDGILRELTRPWSISVEGERIYVVEGTSIYIYSLDDLALNKTFGRSGEGPEEFKIIPTINRGSVHLVSQKDTLIVSSQGKVSFYSPNGEFTREYKVGSIIEWFSGLTVNSGIHDSHRIKKMGFNVLFHFFSGLTVCFQIHIASPLRFKLCFYPFVSFNYVLIFVLNFVLN